ncbi:MAG: GspH/FimT family protein [Thiobacillus sp.]|nr:GspH/FimT family protein [Thiobacillus sp.]
MNGRGFTLVELVVVLAVGAVLLAMAIPSYAFLVNSSRLAAVTNDLVTALHLARSEAIKRGMRVTVCKTSNAMAETPVCDTTASWQQGWLVFVDGGVRGAIDAGDTLLWVHGPVAAGAITAGSNFSDFVSYRSSGVSQGSGHLFNGKLHICLGGNQRDVIINNTGRLRLEPTTC